MVEPRIRKPEIRTLIDQVLDKHRDVPSTYFSRISDSLVRKRILLSPIETVSKCLSNDPKAEEGDKLIQSISYYVKSYQSDDLRFQDVWKKLDEELGLVPNDSAAQQRQLRAYVVADTLVYHISQPLRKRFDAKLRKCEPVEKPIIVNNSPALSALDKLKGTLDQYRESMLTSVDEPISELPAMEARLGFFDNLISVLKEKTMRKITQRHSSEKSLDWLMDRIARQITRICKSPILAEAFLNGYQFNGDNDFVPALWTTAFAYEREYGDSLTEKLRSAYFESALIKNGLWEDLERKYNFPEDFNNVRSLLGKDAEGLNLSMVEIAMGAFFRVDQATAERFLSTVILEPGKEKGVLRLLLGTCSKLKTCLGDQPNVKLFADFLKVQAEQAGTAFLADEFAVLSDQKAGIIHTTPKREAEAKLAENQTKDDFLANEKPKNTEIIYISEKGWREEDKKRIEENQQAPQVISGEVVRTPTWRDVQVPDYLGVRVLVDGLQKRMTALQFASDKYSNLVAEYASNANGGSKNIILIDLLPAGHPLLRLKELGVIGVDNKMSDVSFLLDSKKLGLTTSGPRLVLIKGIINAKQDLVLNFAPEDFKNTSINTLLTAAALLGRTSYPMHPLQKEEVAITRGLAKDWKPIGKEFGLPSLKEVENPQEPEGALVVLPFPGNTFFLSFADK